MKTWHEILEALDIPLSDWVSFHLLNGGVSAIRHNGKLKETTRQQRLACASLLRNLADVQISRNEQPNGKWIEFKFRAGFVDYQGRKNRQMKSSLHSAYWSESQRVKEASTLQA